MLAQGNKLKIFVSTVFEISTTLVPTLLTLLQFLADYYYILTKFCFQICEEEDLGVTNSLFGFENLNVLPLNDNVSSPNPLRVIKSKILSGYSTHTLTQLTTK